MRFWLTSKDDSSSCAILYCLVKMLSFNHPLRISKWGKPSLSGSQTCRRTKRLWILLSLLLFSNWGLGLHVVNITRYVIRIKKHLHNRIEIIEIELNNIESQGIWIVTPLVGGECSHHSATLAPHGNKLQESFSRRGPETSTFWYSIDYVKIRVVQCYG